jgi:hypothetical protein
MIWLAFACICVLSEILVILNATIIGIKKIIDLIKNYWKIYKLKKI